LMFFFFVVFEPSHNLPVDAGSQRCGHHQARACVVFSLQRSAADARDVLFFVACLLNKSPNLLVGDQHVHADVV
jgi:hypothetical protein